MRPPPALARRTPKARRVAVRAADAGVPNEPVKGGRREPVSKGLYDVGDSILIIGDGDMSFSASLAKRFGDKVYIVASCLESGSNLRRKYPEADDNVKIINAAQMRVKYRLDCLKLHSKPEYKRNFTKIVFNFPHLGRKDATAEEHRELLTGFLRSAAPCLQASRESEIHITIRGGEAYQQWGVDRLAKYAWTVRKADGEPEKVQPPPLLACQRTVPFCPTAYPGYTHRRTLGANFEQKKGFNEANVFRDAKTFIFRPTKEGLRLLKEDAEDAGAVAEAPDQAGIKRQCAHVDAKLRKLSKLAAEGDLEEAADDAAASQSIEAQLARRRAAASGETKPAASPEQEVRPPAKKRAKKRGAKAAA